jgi:xanthosine utilization system XapX-like protein
MRKIGLVILLIGLVGLIYFGYQAMQASENFTCLGVDVAVSNADWTPVIFSGVVAVIGFVLALAGKKK